MYGVYSETPATRSPSARSKYARKRQILSSRKSRITANGASTRAPLPFPRPTCRPRTSTRSPRSRNSSGDALELLPVFATVRGVPLDAFASLVAAALIGPGHSRPPLDVRGRELGEEAIDVMAVEGINRSPGDVHFVSGHACRSIAPTRRRRQRSRHLDAGNPKLRKIDRDGRPRPGLAGPPRVLGRALALRARLAVAWPSARLPGWSERLRQCVPGRFGLW